MSAGRNFAPSALGSVRNTGGMLTSTVRVGIDSRNRPSWERVQKLVALLFLLLASGCNRRSQTPPGDSPELARGHELYQRMCAVCHGADGEGYKADQATRLAQPHFLAAASDEFLKVAIEEGRAGTTMSAWSEAHGGPLSPSDVTAVIKRIRSWQKLPRATLDESALNGDTVRGQAIYDKECVSCHGARGVGGPNVHIGAAGFLASASNGFLRHAIELGRSETDMPAFAKKLSRPEIDDVILLLRSWQAPASPPPRVKAPPLPLGPVPLNPKGPEPEGFKATPEMTSVDVAKAALDKGARLAFLDARAPSDYVREHIAGAVSVPFYDPAPYFDKLPKDAWLVCYCACPHAESGKLAQKLREQGFSKVTVLDEGMRVWKDRGYPMAAGEKP